MKPVPAVKSLIHMVSMAHALLAEVLLPGDLAVDLTAGNGHDSFFLYQAVGPQGRVLAFDLQDIALQASARRLSDAGAQIFGPRDHPPDFPLAAGVHLVHACHGRLQEYLREPAKVIIANLGYLPGSTTEVATREDTTLQALQQALPLLAEGGRMAVVAYVGHPGGKSEAERVEQLFSSLPAEYWNVLCLNACNRQNAPLLLMVERHKRAPFNVAVPGS